MIPSVTKPAAAWPHDPVSAAIEDSEVQVRLLKHALAVLRRRLGDRPTTDWLDKARDACQETCKRALQKSAEYNPNFQVHGWLHGILNYVLAEMIKSHACAPAQESAHPEAWEALTATLDSDATESLAAHLDLTVLLAKLPPEHKEIIQLKFYEDLAHAEIAARLGISNGNARVRLCRALAAAKKIAGKLLREDRP
jgi:RNA polymerase sigma-70 factor, ECF subfamily